MKNATIIAFLNEKGGVAKTTTTSSVGAAMASLGKKVLLVDLDPQCSLSLFFGIEEGDFTTYDIMTEERKPVKTVKVRENLWLIPSDIYMSCADMTISGKFQREQILRKFLDGLRKDFDYILLDCPPYMGIINVNVLMCCDRLLVPIVPETLPVKGLRVLTKMLDLISGMRRVPIDGIILTRTDVRDKLHRDMMLGLRLDYGGKVYDQVIHKNTDVAKAPTFFKTIFEYDKYSKGAKDYAALTQEILDRIENHKEN